MQSESINELAAALAKAQGAMDAPTFNRINPHFKNKYADLAAIREAIRKPLADNGLAIVQPTEIREGGWVLITKLLHTSGQWLSSEYPLPVGGKPQEIGAAMTYARRYELCSVLGVAAEDDDDAESANGQKASTPAPKMAPVKVEAPINPETGEVSPHVIAYKDNPIPWGGQFIAAVKAANTAAEIVQWQSVNKDTLKLLRDKYPKASSSIDNAITQVLGQLGKDAA